MVLEKVSVAACEYKQMDIFFSRFTRLIRISKWLQYNKLFQFALHELAQRPATTSSKTTKEEVKKGMRKIDR